MDEVKKAYREGETEVKKAYRQADGDESVGDKVANAGDEVRKDLGNAGDDIRRGIDRAGDEVDRKVTSSTASTTRSRLPRPDPRRCDPAADHSDDAVLSTGPRRHFLTPRAEGAG